MPTKLLGLGTFALETLSRFGARASGVFEALYSNGLIDWVASLLSFLLQGSVLPRLVAVGSVFVLGLAALPYGASAQTNASRPPTQTAPQDPNAADRFHAKVAVLDLNIVEISSKAFLEAAPKLDSLQKALQDEIRIMEEDLKMLRDEIEAQRAVISVEVYTKRIEEFNLRLSQLQRLSQERARFFDEVFREVRDTIQRELVIVTQEVMIRHGIDLVLNTAESDLTLFLFANRLRIDDEVLTEVDKREIAISIPEPPPAEEVLSAS